MAEQQKCDAIFGHFGYEEFPGGMIAPFVYRSDAHLFSMTMLQKHLTLNAPNVTNLPAIAYLKKQVIAATTREIKLLEEINDVHNDKFYPKISFFEKLLRFEDAEQIVKFQIDCVKAKSDCVMECGGFVRFALTNTDDTEYILPYYVKNGTNVTPVDLVKKITQSKQAWYIMELKDIEVLYMKFLVSLYKCGLVISESTLNCVNIDDLKKHCSRVNLLYWPKLMEGVKNTVIPAPNTSTSNNKPKFKDVLSTATLDSTTTNNNEDVVILAPNTSTNNNKQKNDDVVISVNTGWTNIERKHKNVETPTASTTTNNNERKTEDVVISVKTGSKNIKRKHDNSETPTVSKITKSTKNKKSKHQNADNSSKANTGKSNNKHKPDDDSDEKMENGVFVVDYIIKVRPNGDTLADGGEALVRWDGYSSEDNTWEPFENLNDNLQKEARKMLQKILSKKRK